jgi:hypothetical protein
MRALGVETTVSGQSGLAEDDMESSSATSCAAWQCQAKTGHDHKVQQLSAAAAEDLQLLPTIPVLPSGIAPLSSNGQHIEVC